MVNLCKQKEEGKVNREKVRWIFAMGENLSFTFSLFTITFNLVHSLDSFNE